MQMKHDKAEKTSGFIVMCYHIMIAKGQTGIKSHLGAKMGHSISIAK